MKRIPLVLGIVAAILAVASVGTQVTGAVVMVMQFAEIAPLRVVTGLALVFSALGLVAALIGVVLGRGRARLATVMLLLSLGLAAAQITVLLVV